MATFTATGGLPGEVSDERPTRATGRRRASFRTRARRAFGAWAAGGQLAPDTSVDCARSTGARC